MAWLVERVTMAEKRLDEHARDMAAVSGDIRSLTEKIERMNQDVLSLKEDMGRFEARVHLRFEGVDRRFEAIDLKFDGVDRRFEATDARFVIFDQKLDQRFAWLVGIQVLTLLGVASTAVAVFTRSV